MTFHLETKEVGNCSGYLLMTRLSKSSKYVMPEYPAEKISLDPASIRTIINPVVFFLFFEGAHFGEPNQRRTGAHPG